MDTNNKTIQTKGAQMTKEKLEFLLKYIREGKGNKTPSNIILAGIEGHLEGLLENLQ